MKNKTYHLANPYVTVRQKEKIYYGGNQSWNQKKLVRTSGCGITASVDLLFYLNCYRKKCQSKLFSHIHRRGGPAEMSYEQYNHCVDFMYHHYFPILNYFGINGIYWILALNVYFLYHQMPLYARWGVFHKHLWEDIAKMLSDNIPVPLGIGPNFPFLWTNHKLNFYQKMQDGRYRVACQVKAHYVTVTGMDDTWLEIASWGKKYYINREEYWSYVKQYSNFFVSNIVYIKRPWFCKR